MAFDFIPADSDFIHWGDAVDDHNIDWSLSVQVFPEGASNAGYAVSHFAGSQGFALRRNPADFNDWLAFINLGAGDDAIISTGNDVSLDAWQNITLTFDDSGSDGSCTFTMYKDNSQIAQSTIANRVDAGTADFGVGNRSDLARDYDGRVCELAWWRGYLLTSADRAMLANGVIPSALPVKPTFYRQLRRGIEGPIGAGAGTNVNGAAYVEHAPVFDPVGPMVSFVPAAVAVGNPWYHYAQQ